MVCFSFTLSVAPHAHTSLRFNNLHQNTQRGGQTLLSSVQKHLFKWVKIGKSLCVFVLLSLTTSDYWLAARQQQMALINIQKCEQSTYQSSLHGWKFPFLLAAHQHFSFIVLNQRLFVLRALNSGLFVRSWDVNQIWN